MNVNGIAYRSIWVNSDGWSIDIIDQTRLPHVFAINNLKTLTAACTAIRDMEVRGAPLIGATAAYGYYLAMREDPSDAGMQQAYQRLFETRPTAVNLRWALERLQCALQEIEPAGRMARAVGALLMKEKLWLSTSRSTMPSALTDSN